MRSTTAICALWTLAFVLAGPAAADNPHSANHIITNGLPHADCLRKASETFKAAKVKQFGTTSEAIWAYSSDQTQVASIYCLTTRDVAVVIVSGPDRNTNHALVERLVAVWRR